MANFTTFGQRIERAISYVTNEDKRRLTTSEREHLWRISGQIIVQYAMKVLLKVTVLLMLIAASSNCIAEMLIADVSKEEAKLMGAIIRSRKNGDASVEVRMEFKTSGKFEKFRRVELDIGEAKDQIMSAALLPSHPSPGSVAVRFSVNPAYLAKSTLMIVAEGDNPLGGECYRFKLKDFIDIEKPE